MFKLASQLPKRPQLLVESSQRLKSSFFKVEEGVAPETLKPLKQEEELIVKRPWAVRPFLNNEKIKMPIFDFQTGDFL